VVADTGQARSGGGFWRRALIKVALADATWAPVDHVESPGWALKALPCSVRTPSLHRRSETARVGIRVGPRWIDATLLQPVVSPPLAGGCWTELLRPPLPAQPLRESQQPHPHSLQLGLLRSQRGLHWLEIVAGPRRGGLLAIDSLPARARAAPWPQLAAARFWPVALVALSRPAWERVVEPAVAAGQGTRGSRCLIIELMGSPAAISFCFDGQRGIGLAG